MSEKKKFQVPHPIVTLFIVIVIMAICSYILPAGTYERVKEPNTGRQVVDPASFQYVEQSPVGFLQLFTAIPRGMAAGQEIIFFIIIVAGAFQVITATGAIETGIGRVAVSFKNKDYLMIPLIMMLFSIGGATFGMAEENIVFVPIGIALARALGYDAMVGMGMITLGAACGFCSGIMNPFTVGIAQKMAELPIYSGMGLRFVIWAVMIVITSFYVIRYAQKVKKDASKSFVSDLEKAEADQIIDISSVKPLNGRQKLVLLAVFATFAILVYGIFKLEWGIVEIGSLFLIGGIASGIIGGFGANGIVKEFLVGARGMAGGAVMVGVARAILVVMQDGTIIDTIVHGLSGIISGMPVAISAIGIYIVQVVINFFIPSGTGQAAATMPIMIPLADVLNINRQVAVLAYQFGDGFTSYIIPTSGTLMAILSVAKIPYEKWVKFLGPLMIAWLVMGGVFVFIANIINYGPF